MNPNDRGVKTPPRPATSQPSHAQTAPQKQPTRKTFDVSHGFWIVLATTAFLLVAMLITMTVLLIADATATPTPATPSGDGGGQTQTEPKETQASNIGKTKPQPTVPTRDNYVASNDGGAQTISGIQSEAAILVELDAYTATATKNADVRIYPASMTKVMTLLVACEELAKTDNDLYLQDLLTVKQEQVTYAQKMGASGVMGFKAGEQVSMENMLYLINYNSDTVACLAVAEALAGSEAAFVTRMNQKAEEIGCRSTHFVNVTGLHDNDHYTTCREMAAIMAAALDNPLAKKIITSFNGRSIPITPARKNTPTAYAGWYSERLGDNATLSTVTVKGGKTGYEDIPTACFVTYAQAKNGKQYICVTVGRISEAGAKISAAQSTTDTKAVYKNYVS